MSKSQQAANFIKSATQHVLAGLPQTEENAYHYRLATCEKCPFKTDGWKCEKCGCHILTKARWAEQECPEGKWTNPPPPKKKGKGCSSC